MARRSRKAASPAQIAARKKFAERYGKGRTAADNPKKKRRTKRRANPVKAAAPAANPKKRRRRRANPATVRAAAPAANPKKRRRRRANPATARAAAPAANPKRRRRRRAANPRVASYTRKKTVRGHNRRPAKRTRRRDNPAGVTVHTHMHGQPTVADNPKRRRRRRSNPAAARPAAANPKRRRRRRRSNPASYAPAYMPSAARHGMLDNPSYSGLFENPMGAYSMDSLKAFGIASAGVGLGLLVARGIDRFVATMKPYDSKGVSGTKAGVLPWYGKNSVAAIYRRPGIMRLGVQAGGAVLGIGGAYMLRNKPVMPWLLGGIALGFGSNLLLQAFEWYLIPRLLKIEKQDEKSIANRLYVLEQIDTQDKVDAIFEDWQTKPALLAQQAETGAVIVGPLNVDAAGKAVGDDIATLGRIAAGARPNGQPRKFVPDGRVGNCGECGGSGGHYAGCDQCATCNGGRECAYTVEPGDDLTEVVRESGSEIGTIAGLNGGGSPETWWLAGNRVILPEAACHAVNRGAGRRRSAGVSGVQEPPAFTPPPPVTTVAQPQIEQPIVAQPPAPAPNASVAYALATVE